jgi:type IV pilus assembly protein PilX
MQIPSRQRGVVLIYTLIILLILTIGAVALVRSMHSSLFNAGNLAFRRDLVNQGEQAVSNVVTQFTTGTFASSASTQSDNDAANYSSTALPTNSQGIPNVLLNDASFTSTFTAGDITGATGDVKIRYVIDRLCTATGPAIGTQCVQSVPGIGGGPGLPGGTLPPPASTVYRLSVRVSGPRSTQVFLQTTFTKPD